MLEKNKTKLEKMLKSFYKNKENSKSLEEKNQLLLFGKTIDIEVVNSKQNIFMLKEDKLIVKISTNFTKEIKEQIRQKLYIEESKTKITPIFKEWENRMQLFSNNLKYRKTKSQWGSCSSKNNISLNTYLCLLPKELIEYVIIHELSHIKHKNHSKEFWNLVQEYQPNYKNLRKELKKYGQFLK